MDVESDIGEAAFSIVHGRRGAERPKGKKGVGECRKLEAGVRKGLGKGMALAVEVDLGMDLEVKEALRCSG